MLSDPYTFNELCTQSAPALNMSASQVFEGLLDQWWAKVIALNLLIELSLIVSSLM